MHRVKFGRSGKVLANFIAKPRGTIATKFYVFKARISASKI